MAGISELQNFVVNALEAIEFKLIRDKEDINDESIKFHPAMAHQIFGESESIFGYKDIKVHIMYAANSLDIYLNIKHDGRVEEDDDELKADDVMGIITSKLPLGSYVTSIDEFVNKLEKGKNFKPFGEKLEQYLTEDKSGKERHFEIYHCGYHNEKFIDYFSRLQTFVLWFVDAASYIDVDDSQWTYFVCYEKYKDNDGNFQFAPVGYTTVYKYYAYPEHIRPRISQMLVLPQFQKLGIGTRLLETVCRYFAHEESVIDITVEDPSDDFMRIRNFVDAKFCKNLASFNADKLKGGFSKEMINEAKQRFKINRKQCRIVYEILRLYYTNRNNTEEYESYRLDVKKRFNMVFYKQLKNIEKMKKAGEDVQWINSKLPTLKERLQLLELYYNGAEEGYLKVIEKLRDIDQ